MTASSAQAKSESAGTGELDWAFGTSWFLRGLALHLEGSLAPGSLR